MSKINKKLQNYINISESEITTILADDITFQGTIKFKSSLMIKGKYTGDLSTDGLLLIGEDARIKANVKANIIISNGHMEGNIEAKNCVILKQSGSHIGNISTPNLVMESGALFSGKSIMPIEINKKQSDTKEI